MCGRFTRFHTWADIHEMYRLLPATETGRNTEARYNIAPTEDVYFVTAGEDGTPEGPARPLVAGAVVGEGIAQTADVQRPHRNGGHDRRLQGRLEIEALPGAC